MKLENRIQKIKDELKVTILEFYEITDSYSCGINLALYINPKASSLLKKMVNLVEQLQLIDLSFPQKSKQLAQWKTWLDYVPNEESIAIKELLET
jgi:hypothetical protein